MVDSAGLAAAGVEVEKVIELRRQVDARALPRDAGDDSPVLLVQTGINEGLTIVAPSKVLVGKQPLLLNRRQSLDGKRESADGFFHAIVGRSQLEPAVEELQRSAEFRLHQLERIVVGIRMLITHCSLVGSSAGAELTVGNTRPASGSPDHHGVNHYLSRRLI
jgi:hypothetical protein